MNETTTALALDTCGLCFSLPIAHPVGCPSSDGWEVTVTISCNVHNLPKYLDMNVKPDLRTYTTYSQVFILPRFLEIFLNNNNK